MHCKESLALNLVKKFYEMGSVTEIRQNEKRLKDDKNQPLNLFFEMLIHWIEAGVVTSKG